jgi:hypothetical protein
MVRLPPNRAATRTVAQHNDAGEMRTVIAETLGATPVDEQGLREAVWTYVRGEREVGVAPGLVILALTTMVADAKIAPDDAEAILAEWETFAWGLACTSWTTSSPRMGGPCRSARRPPRGPRSASGCRDTGERGKPIMAHDA